MLLFKIISPKLYGSYYVRRTVIMLIPITPSSPKLQILQFNTPVEVWKFEFSKMKPVLR
jgi:hypothetical protein